jgi:tRNA threonylcarbamoyladenosine biosynthesis protein TsaE
MNNLCVSVEDTRNAGAGLAVQASAGDVYGLVGDLGTGKTEFVRGFVAALEPAAGVHSPTFTLVNIYDCLKWPVYHFDFYRLKNSGELREIGFYEYAWAGDGVCLVEWADMFPEALPEGTRMIRFSAESESVRRIEMI